jgi:hypothetical protein
VQVPITDKELLEEQTPVSVQQTEMFAGSQAGRLCESTGESFEGMQGRKGGNESMTQAILNFKKILNKGEPAFVYKGSKNVLNKEHVPDNYLYDGDAHFYSSSDGDCLWFGGKPHMVCGNLLKGSILTPKEMQEIVRFCKKAGTHLIKCKKEMAELKPKWDGQIVPIEI